MLSLFKRFIGIGKKIFLVIAVYFIIISLFSYFISRDRPKITQDPIVKNREAIYKIINDTQLNKTKQGKLVAAAYKLTVCGLLGEACTNNPDDGDKNFKNSLIGKAAGLLATPYTQPPASGVLWAYNGLQSAGLISKSYAAEGFGFATIRPYAEIWKIFRDVAYMLLVIILVAMGFMIMFRMKLNPQTVISVENALPKIVVALILVTFSFAIAGFMIDLMYVSIILIVSILSKGNTFYNATQFQNEFVMANALKLFNDVTLRADYGGSLIPSLAGALLGLFPQFIVTGFRVIIGGLTIFVLNGILHNALVGPIGEALNDVTVGAASFIVGIGNIPGALLKTSFYLLIIMIVFVLGMYVIFPILAFILLAGTFVFLFFRIFALFFTSYIKLLLNIILSPFLLMFEAVPGKSPFTGWFKNILGYLMVFPIAIAVFLVGYIIVNSSTSAGYSEMRLPYLWGIDSNSFKILVGVGLVLMIPDLVKAAKEAIGIKELPLNLGVGTFFGGAGTLLGGGMGLMGQFSSINLGMSGIRGITELLGGKKVKTEQQEIEERMKQMKIDVEAKKKMEEVK